MQYDLIQYQISIEKKIQKENKKKDPKKKDKTDKKKKKLKSSKSKMSLDYNEDFNEDSVFVTKFKLQDRSDVLEHSLLYQQDHKNKSGIENRFSISFSKDEEQSPQKEPKVVEEDDNLLIWQDRSLLKEYKESLIN